MNFLLLEKILTAGKIDTIRGKFYVALKITVGVLSLVSLTYNASKPFSLKQEGMFCGERGRIMMLVCSEFGGNTVKTANNAKQACCSEMQLASIPANKCGGRLAVNPSLRQAKNKVLFSRTSFIRLNLWASSRKLPFISLEFR